MDKTFNWLKDEWTGWKLLFGPILCLLISLAYLKLVMVSGISFFQSPVKPTPPLLTLGILIGLVLYYFLCALWEELLFRVPIVLLFSIHRNNPKIFITFIIAFSAIFGLCHGSIYNIILQGFHGLIFSLVFTKTGGLNLGLGTLRAWFIATAIHAGYNVSIMLFPQFLLT